MGLSYSTYSSDNMEMVFKEEIKLEKEHKYFFIDIKQMAQDITYYLINSPKVKNVIEAELICKWFEKNLNIGLKLDNAFIDRVCEAYLLDRDRDAYLIGVWLEHLH